VITAEFGSMSLIFVVRAVINLRNTHTHHTHTPHTHTLTHTHTHTHIYLPFLLTDVGDTRRRDLHVKPLRIIEFRDVISMKAILYLSGQLKLCSYFIHFVSELGKKKKHFQYMSRKFIQLFWFSGKSVEGRREWA